LGQQIERFDLILRLYQGFDFVTSEWETMGAIAKGLNNSYQPIEFIASTIGEALEKVNGVIDQVIMTSLPSLSQSQG
jgi:hypothetical protein